MSDLSDWNTEIIVVPWWNYQFTYNGIYVSSKFKRTATEFEQEISGARAGKLEEIKRMIEAVATRCAFLQADRSLAGCRC
jgi:hypothetical protein